MRVSRGTELLCPERGDSVGDFFLEDFDEFFVLVDDFLLSFNLYGDLGLEIGDFGCWMLHLRCPIGRFLPALSRVGGTWLANRKSSIENRKL